MKKERIKRGGAREGAGRKLIGREKRITLAIRIEPNILLKLENMAETAGMSKGRVIEQLIVAKYEE